MTGRELHRHRCRLGYRTLAGFGAAVGLKPANARRTVSRWEAGDTPVPLYVQYLVDALYTGWKPPVQPVLAAKP